MISHNATPVIVIVFASVLVAFAGFVTYSKLLSLPYTAMIVMLGAVLIVFSAFNVNNHHQAKQHVKNLLRIGDYAPCVRWKGGDCSTACQYATVNCEYQTIDECKNDNGCGNNCLPGHATLMTPTGAVPVKNLKRGSLVLDSSGQFKPIIFVSHHDDSVVAKFVEIVARDANGKFYKLTQTEHHYALVDNQRIYAKDVRIGDTMQVVSGHAVVVQKQIKTYKGIYAPYTLSGTLYVDGVLTSCYSNWWYDNPDNMFENIVLPFLDRMNLTGLCELNPAWLKSAVRPIVRHTPALITAH